MALREMIEKYIAEGKLTRKNQAGVPPKNLGPRDREPPEGEVRLEQHLYYQERRLAQLPRADPQADDVA
jgi:hypothetical protein